MTRLANCEIVEKTEEIRLKLVQLLRNTIANYGQSKQLASYLDNIVDILKVTLRDQFHHVIAESCYCICQLADCLQTTFHLRAECLLTPTLEALKHQLSTIRISAIYATGKFSIRISSKLRDFSNSLLIVKEL